MLRKMLLTLTITALSAMGAAAQFYSAGTVPSGISWRQIKSEHYNIIYPQEIDSLAREFLYKMEYYRPLVLEPLQINPEPQPVILHPYTTFSNGSVAVAPTRMDLIPTPEAYRPIPQDWLNQLVLHEIRHTGEDDHFTKGAYHTLSYILGEQVYGAGLGLFIPKLSLEGDAVVSETELSDSGRGRNADFFQMTRVMFLTGDSRSYKKMLHGSNFKDAISAYNLGYLCYVYDRMETGDYFYPGKMLEAYSKGFEGVKELFQSKDKRKYKTWEDQYNGAVELFTNYWRNDDIARGEHTKYTKLYKKRGHFKYLVKVDDNIYAVKNGIRFIPELVRLDKNGKQHHISYFSADCSPLSNPVGDRFYWSESVYSNTATMLNYSIIRYYDFKKKSFGDLTSKTRYFNPQPNQDGNIIAVAEYPVTGSSFLVQLSDKGEIISRTEAPDKGQIVEPAFIGDDIYCSIIFSNGIGLYKWDGKEWTEIQKPQSQSIASMRAFGKNLYFSSDLDGLNNVYRFNTEDKSLTRLTNAKYGAGFPFLNEDAGIMYYSEYEPYSYKPSKMAVSDFDNTPYSFDEPGEYPFIRELEQQHIEQAKAEPDYDAVKYLDAEKTQSKEYSKLGHSLHFHSWAPLYYNVDKILANNFDQLYSVVSPGITAYSQNDLGNITTMVGYAYQNGRNAGHLKTTANVFYGTIEFSADYNERSAVNHLADTTVSADKSLFNSKLRLYKQILFYKGGWTSYLTPLVEINFANDKFEGKSLFQIRYGVSFSRNLGLANNQIFPRFGFGLTAYRTSMAGLKNIPALNYLYGYAYLPGVILSNGVKISATFQSKKDRLQTTSASMPRGYGKWMVNGNFFKVTADYAIPVYLGDTDLGAVYLRRLQVIPFFDYALDSNNSDSVSHYSFGGDFLVDFNVFQFAPKFKAGVRYSRTPLLDSKNRIELLFNISM